MAYNPFSVLPSNNWIPIIFTILRSNMAFFIFRWHSVKKQSSYFHILHLIYLN